MTSSREAIACALASFAFSALPTNAATSVNIYASPVGNNSNPGSADRPVASLAVAQELTRKATGQRAVNVWLLGGTHYLPGTVVFTAADSETEHAPILRGIVRKETEAD